jgi:hypothetical protein
MCTGLITLGADGSFGDATVYSGASVVRAAPFDAVEIDLSALWA